MAEKLTQYESTQPIFQAQPVSTKAEGYQAFAKALTQIAGESAQKATEYASEASKANLLQQHSMLNDVAANAKAQIEKDPGMANEIANKTAYTVDTIKRTAALNKADRMQFNYLADGTVRDIKIAGDKAAINVAKDSAIYAYYEGFDSTRATIQDKLYTDPKQADILINATYDSLRGMVKSQLLTPIQAENLHKVIENEIHRAQLRGSEYQKGIATPKSVNTLNSFSGNTSIEKTAQLPMTETSRHIAASHLQHMSAKDYKSEIASNHDVPAWALRFIQSDSEALSLQKYKYGAAKANGLIYSGGDWKELKHTADILNTQRVRLSDEQEGTRDRLNNHIIGIEKNHMFSNFVMQTPYGARATINFANQNAAIDKYVFNGMTKEQSDIKKMQARKENLNNYISTLNSIGIGMDIPDQYRIVIPDQYVAPVSGAFDAGADPASAINTITVFNDSNRTLLANSMANPRRALTVYETGKILGQAEPGFLSDYWHSQQEGLNFKELQTDTTGMSDSKLKDLVNPYLKEVNNYLSRQPNGVQLASASTEKAIRYLKYMAAKYNDPVFSMADDNMVNYSKNIGERAYQIKSDWNYMLDKNVVPLESNQMSYLAAHALNATYKKMREYMNEAQLEEFTSRNQPYLLSTPNGRVVVVDASGRAIADKNGHAAFDEFYTEGLLRVAEADREAGDLFIYNNPFLIRNKPYDNESTLWKKMIRQTERERGHVK